MGGASRWRVCYQRGLPRLVFTKIQRFEPVLGEICNNTEVENILKGSLMSVATITLFC